MSWGLGLEGALPDHWRLSFVLPLVRLLDLQKVSEEAVMSYWSSKAMNCKGLCLLGAPCQEVGAKQGFFPSSVAFYQMADVPNVPETRDPLCRGHDIVYLFSLYPSQLYASRNLWLCVWNVACKAVLVWSPILPLVTAPTRQQELELQSMVWA